MRPQSPLPEAIIRVVLEKYCEAMLIGAHARDYIVQNKAGLDQGRTTYDLDFAVAVQSFDDYRAQTESLTRHGDTGTGFVIHGVHVDLLPFLEGEVQPRVVRPMARQSAASQFQAGLKLHPAPPVAVCLSVVLASDEIEQWIDQIAAKNGYREPDHDVEIYALCPDC